MLTLFFSERRQDEKQTLTSFRMVTQKLALQWLPDQAPGVIGSALGLVGPVSVYCDWVR